MKRHIFLALLFIGIIVPKSLRAQTPHEEYFQRGVQLSENIFEFLSNRPCELGLEPGCAKPFSARDLTILRQYLTQLEVWRVIAFDGIVPMSQIDLKFLQEVLLLQDQELYLLQTERAVATNLVLYDSFFRLLDILSQSKKLRQLLEGDLAVEGTFLTKTLWLAMDEARWDKTQKALKLLNQFPRRERTLFGAYSAQSVTSAQMQEDTTNQRLKKVLFIQSQRRESRFFERLYQLTGTISRWFGNTAGLFQFRKGLLKSLSVKEVSHIKSQLKPLSLLIEKTPFRLTDKFIPGYFGHVAIWLGSPHELVGLKINHQGREIDFLDHPDVKSHLPKLAERKMVLEALRLPGVTLNTLEHFMDVDDLIVIDPPALTDSERARLVLRAFQQVGKPYDFNFNVETENEIVCSELIYTVFDHITWPTERSVGRFTISPDHVAWRAISESMPVKVAYLKGKMIKHDLCSELRKVLESQEGIDLDYPKPQCQL